MAERVDRPLSLFDELEAVAPVIVPERERAMPEAAAPALPEPATVEAAEPAAVEADDGGTVEARGGVGGEPTLDELIVGAWEGLTAQAVAACPVCDAGVMRPVYADAGAASLPVAGRCTTCGTTLS